MKRFAVLADDYIDVNYLKLGLEKALKQKKIREDNRRECVRLIAKNLAQINELIKTRKHLFYSEFSDREKIQKINDDIQRLFTESELAAAKLTDDIDLMSSDDQERIRLYQSIDLTRIEELKEKNIYKLKKHNIFYMK
jgi:hypothetical protein